MIKTKTIAALAIAAGALAVGPASASAAKFGSDLDHTVQPSNSVPAHHCDANPSGKCTWVMGEAYGNPGGETSPKRGKLRKVKLIAGTPGKFRLQVVKTRPNGKTKVKRNGPVIKYEGQDQANWDTDHYKVERFRVNLRIRKGWRLAIKAKEASMLRCSSGGPNTLLYTPPLAKGGPFTPYDDTDGCWMLLQGKVR